MTPCSWASVCSSQWPDDTHTAHTWFRSDSSSSSAIFRYDCSCGELVVTASPSCTGVVQAGRRRATPETSTMHSRHAPTETRPSM